MRKNAKLILIALLLIENGYMILRWIQEASQTNDVGRQWIRLIIPAIIVIQSVTTFIFVWLIDKFLKYRKTKTTQ